MVSTLSSQTFASTYKDDFADSAGFHRILFNSGKALQARELTQLQTILQTQIERFGSNIFKEGAVVKPGGANLNQKYELQLFNHYQSKRRFIAYRMRWIKNMIHSITCAINQKCNL